MRMSGLRSSFRSSSHNAKRHPTRARTGDRKADHAGPSDAGSFDAGASLDALSSESSDGSDFSALVYPTVPAKDSNAASAFPVAPISIADEESATSQHLATVFPGFLSVMSPQTNQAETTQAAASRSLMPQPDGIEDQKPEGEAEEVVSHRWQDGWLAGLQQGREEGRSQAQAADREAQQSAIEGARQQVLAVLDDFAAERERCLHELEQEAVRLALAIAARILRREAQMDPLLLSGAVRVALNQLGESAKVQIIVPEADRALWEESLRLTPGLRQRPEVVGDARMELGECRIETGLGENGFGGADLSLHEQLREIERGFFDRLPRRPATQTPASVDFQPMPAPSVPVQSAPHDPLPAAEATGAPR